MADTPADQVTTSAPAKSLGQATSRGFTWMSLSLALGKVALFLAQVVLGWILTKEEFGVFAIAATVIAFIKIFQDGGIPQVLVQRGDAEFNRLQGAMFWLTMCVSTLAGIGLAAASPWISHWYGDQRLIGLLCVLAACLPLGAPANMLRARLQLELRFRAIATVSAVQFILRGAGMIVLAYLGFGVMSFVLPVVLVAIVSDVMTYLYTRSKPWKSPVLIGEWPALLRDSNWVVVATVFKGLARNGDYLVLGLLLSQQLLGVYYFAYQLTIQSTVLVALNLRHVLFPVMTKLATQPVRQASAIIKAIRMLMLTVAPGSILLALTIRPLEAFIWHLKWQDAVPLVQVFALVSPFLIFTDVVHAALTSRGRFRLSAALTLAEGLWLVASAWFAVQAAGNENLTGVAMWIFGLQVTYAIVVSGWLLTWFEISPAQFVSAVLPQWLVGLASAAFATLTLRLLPAEPHPLIQIIVLTAVYLAAFAGGAFLMLRAELEELASVAPRPIAATVRKLFQLRPAGTASGGR